MAERPLNGNVAVNRGVPLPVRAGLFDPCLGAARFWATARWGPGIAAAVASAAWRFPMRPAIVDDDGIVTYTQLDGLATQLARVLRSRSAGAVGILCRNHRGFVVAQVAAERAGRDVVLLSTALPSAALAAIVEREDLSVIFADREFEELLAGLGLPIRTAPEVRRRNQMAEREVLLADGPEAQAWMQRRPEVGWVPPPRSRARLVMLTSGTTGAPKGAGRANRAPGIEALSMLREIPYRMGDLYLVAPPLFHAWGLSQMTMALGFASTVILRRRFDVAETVQLMREREIDVLAVVPLMLRRILNHMERTPLNAIPPKPPRITACSGNVLSGDLSAEWMDRFGDRLYNFYGSTETGIGTIARPADMRRAPGTVGRPPQGVNLAVLDEEGMPLPPGELGAIHLSSRMQFDGYTDGTNRERNGSLMATNDLGYIDDHGLLHVDGRAGDMIVTGGENVFPSAVEQVIDRQVEVEMSAVVGQDDPEFGQRVVAFVVSRSGKPVDVDRLRAALERELPSFMVPKEFHMVEALPMTTTGKVIRRELSVLGMADKV